MTEQPTPIPTTPPTLAASAQEPTAVPTPEAATPAIVEASTTTAPNAKTPPLSEFRYDNGKWLNGDCLETALATAMALAKGSEVTQDSINAVVNDLTTEGKAQANGATTLADCHDYAVAKGYGVLKYVPYAEPFNGDFHALILQYAVSEFQSPPIVVNVANGQALPGDEKGLHYHGITIVGRDATGYLVADGDRLQANEAYQHYTIDELEAAKPCGLLVLTLQRDAVEHSYVVQDGDNLEHIALTLGVTLAHLESQNTWIHDPNVIYPGQHIAY